MKSYSNLISIRHLLLTLIVVQLSSCSWISSRRSLFGDDETEKSQESEEVKTVSKSQFDSLNEKYESLLKERQLERVQGGEANQMMNQMEETNKDPSMVINDLGKVKNAELAETVDVFAQKQQATSQREMTTSPLSLAAGGNQETPALVEEHINKVRKAENLVASNKFDSALTMIKELEKSPIRQIVVRAKYLLGEILFKQGEYDLSMQVFEEILEQHAFSGLVIKTLGRLIVCSDKLKISEKQEKYYSILHDFFEQGS